MVVSCLIGVVFEKNFETFGSVYKCICSNKRMDTLELGVSNEV